MTPTTTTISESDAVETETVRKVELGAITWCDHHREVMIERGCDPMFATLDLVQRATENDVWDEIALDPADVEFRVGLEGTEDQPYVHVISSKAASEVEITPLCCAVGHDALESTFVMAQDTKE